MGRNILVVDDEASMRNSLARLLTVGGYSVRVATCAHEGLACARKERPDLVLLDIRLPDMSGHEVLTRLKRMNRRVVVIVMTAYESTRDAVMAMKGGAYDYLSKPFNIDAVRLLVRQALSYEPGARSLGPQPSKALRSRAASDLRAERFEGRGHNERSDFECAASNDAAPWQGSACDRMIGTSPAMQSVLDIIHRLPAGSVSTVLIEGETGTGKELLAHAVHETSGRAGGHFVAIGCGAIPRELIESELFGYDRGAFTGARREGKQGAFERAGTGTIFLDEIGELDLDLQVKLLRVLEAREFSRVGGVREVRLRARVIAATNRDLGREVHGGRFRADLYFRLNVIRVRLPPLRERVVDNGTSDVMLLAEGFLREFNARFGKNFKTISPPARKLLEGYPWPGNVRELRNVIERIVLLEGGEAILPEMLATCLVNYQRDPPRLPAEPSRGAVRETQAALRWAGGEEERIASALERTGGNVVRAARLLGLKRGALRYRMDKYGVARRAVCDVL